MRASRRSALRVMAVLALSAAVAACAPAPLYKTGPSSVTATPQQVATAPANFGNLQVVWGGSVIAVRNLADHSEIEILAYPLDSSQRPRLKQPATGRFIALMPGFVEPMDYPPGSLVTLRGTLGKAIRAPNINELFTAGVVSGSTMMNSSPPNRPNHSSPFRSEPSITPQKATRTLSPAR